MLETIFSSPSQAVAALFGESARVKQQQNCAGGDINQAARLLLDNGQACFVKKNRPDCLTMFQVEARGLLALSRATGALSVVRPLAVGQNRESAFLILELVESGSKGPDFWQKFGAGLAEMHQNSGTNQSFGFDHDNFIGSTPQNNSRAENWLTFYAKRRLWPQTKMLASTKRVGSNFVVNMEKLIGKLPELLEEPDKPSLLHGDLWAGNYLVNRQGEPTLIDPAAYYGHRETDLAMTELFGGYAAPFYHAYREAGPLTPGYAERRDLYNLYHILNHANLFGGSYAGQADSIIRRYL